ncbi:ABC transporter permease [Burkholderiaceae bacterium FT117]|uniref:ABC transporter permease n=1 Tax=Zeimonas sediminis TaxID=2944268 RepID=UPI0023431975|nr:ABC transporter permease [Zeimonas sediminis]MCM5569632.1 ABC transporter permease [Zeimonas sediminis]
MSAALQGWLWQAQLRAQPGRLAAAAAAIAIGVALALAIHLVNRSALDEFDAALATVNGEAQARVESRAGSFDERLWPRIAAAPEIAAASPVIEASFAIAAPGEAKAGQPGSGAAEGPRLRVIGIDPLRAARVTPTLLPSAEGADAGAGTELFADDAIFLSQRALELAGRRVGDPLTLLTAGGPVRLRIAGTVARAPADVALAVMDIGTMQWRLGWLGRLSRIDLRLAPGTSPAALAAPDALGLPADLIVTTPDASRQRMSNLSRAYRVNLTVLALVALFTGGFIVHSAMALAVARERSRLALLGVLGAGRGFLVRQVLGLGLIPGLAGALLGVLAGVAGARLLLAAVGGDLGGGYFAGSTPALSIDPSAMAGFGLAGLATAVVGSLASARRIARQPAARMLREGSADELPAARIPAALPLLLFGAGALLLAAPPLNGLPIAAYLTIALWLVAGIAILPRALAAAGRHLRGDGTARAGAIAWLAAQRVAAAPGSASAALGGIVAAVALASAMAIMVTSFRTSVDQWLGNVLPADLYGRIENAGPLDGIDAAAQARIAAITGAARVEFLHATRLILDPQRPPVALLARPIDASAPQQRLPVTGALRTPPAGATPVWVSEAVVDLYGWRPGDRVALPVPDKGAAPPVPDNGLAPPAPAEPAPFFVAGVWRDYARQHGAIVVDLDAWRRLAGEARVTDLAVWLAPDADEEAVAGEIRDALAGAATFELRSAATLRALSLTIFDRSFAATWALEAVAILVALFGVASAWSAEAIARRREFGMMRHLGVQPAAIVGQFAIEAAVLVAAAVCWGIALGAAIALVLVHWVNPQSFHWTMDIDWPAATLAGGAFGMIALAVVVAALAARQASSASPVRAVREDW